MKYALAELFYSIQGEGANAGRAALFVRLAGCCVGRVPSSEELALFKPAENHTLCTTYSGETFVCDTNYKKWKDFEHQEILVELAKLAPQCKLVFITGGEPLMWNLEPLVAALAQQHYEVWIETSGVKAIPISIRRQASIVVSPKAWYQASAVGAADHLKVLVHGGTSPQELEEFEECQNVYLQPIEDADPCKTASNLEWAIELVKENPRFRLGVQLHKYLKLP